MSERQLYRLRAPSYGREIFIDAEPGKVYRTRTRASRSRSWGRCSRCTRRSRACHGPSRPALLQLVRPARSEGSQRLSHVRPPDGRAAPLRGGRMRFAPRLAVPIACSPCRRRLRRQPPSPSRSPGRPAELEVPGDGAGARRREPAPTPTATRDGDRRSRVRPAPRPCPRRDRRPPPTRRPTAPTGGGAAALPTTRRRRPTSLRPAGSHAEQFEDFCAENPGAC